jgi:hypothetical protein
MNWVKKALKATGKFIWRFRYEPIYDEMSKGGKEDHKVPPPEPKKE